MLPKKQHKKIITKGDKKRGDKQINSRIELDFTPAYVNHQLFNLLIYLLVVHCCILVLRRLCKIHLFLLHHKHSLKGPGIGLAISINFLRCTRERIEKSAVVEFMWRDMKDKKTLFCGCKNRKTRNIVKVQSDRRLQLYLACCMSLIFPNQA